MGQEDLCLRRRLGTLEGRLGRQTGSSPGWPGSCITFSKASLLVVRGTPGPTFRRAEPSGLLTRVTLQTVGSLSCMCPLSRALHPRDPERGQVRWETRERSYWAGGLLGHQASPQRLAWSLLVQEALR